VSGTSYHVVPGADGMSPLLHWKATCTSISSRDVLPHSLQYVHNVHDNEMVSHLLMYNSSPWWIHVQNFYVEGLFISFQSFIHCRLLVWLVWAWPTVIVVGCWCWLLEMVVAIGCCYKLLVLVAGITCWYCFLELLVIVWICWW
jgi:hypothetical protein